MTFKPCLCMILVSISVVRLASLDASGGVRPHSGEGHELRSNFEEAFGATSVCARIGKAMFWYDHGGKPDPKQPMPGFGILEYSEFDNDWAEGASIVSDGKLIFNQPDRFPVAVPRAIIEQLASAKSVSIKLHTSEDKDITVELTAEDKKLLGQFVQWGSDYKPTTRPLDAAGHVGYVVLTTPGMSKCWNTVKQQIIDEVKTRRDIDHYNIIRVDSAVRLSPGRGNYEPQIDKGAPFQIISAMNLEPAAPLTKRLGHDLVEWAEDRNERTLVLLVADDLPDEFCEEVLDNTSRANIRLRVVWVGQEEAKPESIAHMRHLADMTGGTYYTSLSPEDQSTRPSSN